MRFVTATPMHHRWPMERRESAGSPSPSPRQTPSNGLWSFSVLAWPALTQHLAPVSLLQATADHAMSVGVVIAGLALCAVLACIARHARRRATSLWVVLAHIAAVVFCAELLIMLLMHACAPLLNEWTEALLDSASLTLFCAPLIYLGLIRPLNDELRRRIANAEQFAASLRDSEEKYRTLVENVRVGIYRNTGGPEGRFIHANRAVADMFGYASAEELMAVPIAALYDDPRDRQRFLEKISQRGSLRHEELKLRKKDGTPIWVSVTATVTCDRAGHVQWMDGILEDVTARKRAEQELRAHALFMQQVLDAIPSPIFCKDAQGCYTLTNRAFEALVAVPRDQLAGQTVATVAPAEFAAVDEHLDHVALKEPTVLAQECALVSAEGTPMQVVLDRASILDEAGMILGTVGTLLDITARKQAEAQLAEDVTRFKGLCELAAAMSTGNALEANFRLAVEQACALLKADAAILALVDEGGGSPGGPLHMHTLHGLRDPRFQGLRLPAGTGLGGLAMQQGGPCVVTDYLTDGRLQHSVDELVAAEGLVAAVAVPVQVGVVPLGVLYVWKRSAHQFSSNDGELVSLIGNLIGIQILRERAEEARRLAKENLIRMAAALDQATEGILITDLGGRIQYVNHAFEQMTGYLEAEALGQNPRILKSGQHTGEFYRDLWQTIGRGDVWSGRLVNRRKDGSVYQEEASISPVRDSAGHVTNYVMVKRDVTRQIAFEQQLRQAQKLEAIGQLAAGIAHEINTPTQYVGDNVRFLQDNFAGLTALLARYGQLLEAAKQTPACRDQAGQIEAALRELDLAFLLQEIPKAIDESLEGIGRVTQIVRAMKDFSHPDGEGKTCVDLNRAIESTVTVARNRWKYVADLQLDLAADLPPVPCYAGEFNQVILNLVANAADAIADVVGDGAGGKGKITVSSRLVDGNWVEVRVADTGTGIPPEAQPRIFDPFFTTKEVGKGTGQGLSIAHAVVAERHQGTVHFETEPGRGTTFIIRLPLVETAASPGTADVGGPASA